MRKSPKRNKPTATTSLRIIGGKYRGRKVSIPQLDGLRPTSDRIRETLFNWLQFELPGMKVLDLFAGTGALGLESLSRDADSAVFVEPQNIAAAGLKQSLATLELTGNVYQLTAERYLQGTVTPFDLVFVDPPFSLDLWNETLSLLVERGWLKAGGLVYLESPANQTIDIPDSFETVKEKTGGRVCFRLLRLNAAP